MATPRYTPTYARYSLGSEMTLLVRLGAVALMGLCTTTASAQPPVIYENLSPDQIRQAIALGSTVKDRVPDMGIVSLSTWTTGGCGAVGFVSTPWYRVAVDAHRAWVHYEPYTLDDAMKVVAAGELHIYARLRPDTASGVNVETVVITPRKGTEEEKHAKVIKPTRVETKLETFRNLTGAEIQSTAMIAVFPLSVWSEDNEIHVVADNRDCPARFPSGASIH